MFYIILLYLVHTLHYGYSFPAHQQGRKLTVHLCFLCLSLGEEDFMCKTSSISDIVILVDGSWSIGRINFRLVRTFLENLVKAFSVEFDHTRIGEELCLILNSLIHTVCLLFEVPYLASSGLKSVV